MSSSPQAPAPAPADLMADTPPIHGDAEIGRLVHRFLTLSMIPDPVGAAAFLADAPQITFTGGRAMSHPREMATFNARRYRWVKKRIERYDVVTTAAGHVVYSLGTLYGEWPDGTAFSGNRYVDRFEVVGGRITRIDVWNDSAERILTALEIER